MNTLFSYSLAASVMVILLLPVLYQIVNRCRQFGFNRACILCGMVTSTLLPFILPILFKTHTVNPIVTDTTSTIGNIEILGETVGSSSQEPTDGFDIIAFAIMAYAAGVILFLARECYAYAKLYTLIRGSKKEFHDGYTICRLEDESIAPFSWGKYIFVTSANEIDTSILLHERAHTAKRHWMDILFADFFCILLWYNPFAWMTRQLMKLNHEFETDAAVIQSGVDTYGYQRLLITKAMGLRAISVTNSLASGKRGFRKRVLIMNQKRSSKKTMLIAVLSIPAIIVGVIAIASPVSAGLLAKISDYTFEKESITTPKEEDLNSSENTPIDATLISIVDPESSSRADAEATVRLPSPLKDQTALSEIIRLSMATIDVDKETKVNIGIVIDENGRVTDVATDTPDNPLVEAVVDQALNGILFEQMTDNGKPITMHFNIPVTIKGKENNIITPTTRTSEQISFPEFIGGNSALSTFIIENIKTPDVDTKSSTTQSKKTVNVNFTVNIDGSITDITTPVPQGEIFDNEAIRIINLTSGKWKPALQNGKPISYSVSLPITFSTL